MDLPNLYLLSESTHALQNKTSQYIGENAPKDAQKYRYYNSYDLGMYGVTNYINCLTSEVSTIEGYYKTSLKPWDFISSWFGNQKTITSSKTQQNGSLYSLYSLFTFSLAYYMAGEDGSDMKNNGLKLLIDAFDLWGDIGASTTGFFVYNGALTSQFGSAHAGETYMAMLDLTPVEELKRDKFYNMCIVNCPVDVYIKDSSGKILGEIENNDVIVNDNSLSMDIQGDSKSFIVPENADYTIELIGNDTGKMDYSICKYDGDKGEVERTVYQDVILYEGAIYTQPLAGFQYAEDAPVYNEDEQLLNEKMNLDAESIGKLSISVNVIGRGYTNEYESVTPGDYVTLYATPFENEVFIGWYDIEGNLLSKEVEMSFSVKESREFIAEFTDNETNKIVKGDVTGDGEIAMGDVVKTARAVAGIEELTLEQKEAADVTGNREVAMDDVIKIARYVAGTIAEL